MPASTSRDEAHRAVQVLRVKMPAARPNSTLLAIASASFVGVERHHDQQRAEDLLAGDAHRAETSSNTVGR
jgi:hypothetical protein